MTLRPGTARCGRPIRLRGIGYIASGWPTVVAMVAVLVVLLVMVVVVVAAVEIRWEKERKKCKKCDDDYRNFEHKSLLTVIKCTRILPS